MMEEPRPVRPDSAAIAARLVEDLGLTAAQLTTAQLINRLGLELDALLTQYDAYNDPAEVR